MRYILDISAFDIWWSEQIKGGKMECHGLILDAERLTVIATASYCQKQVR
jgi:hypothetical protein